MIKAIAKPFIQVLLKKKIAVSRWSLLKALIKLAVLKRLKKTAKGVKFRLGSYFINAPDYDVISILLKEKFVDEEYYFQTDSVRPIIIDCGANVGISALYFKCLYPHCQIHCFEPYDQAYEYLVKNVEENRLKDVFLYRKAISDIDGEVSLYIPADENIINATVVKNPVLPSHKMVQSMKLSGFLKSFNEVDLVKLDVEGTETDIIHELYSSGELASAKIKAFTIEYHTKTNGSPKFITDELTGSGYKIASKTLFPENPESDILLYAKKTLTN